MVTKKQILSRIRMLEEIVFKLVSRRNDFEDVCRSCQHNKCYVSVDGRIVTYCDLYAKEKCADFTPRQRRRVPRRATTRQNNTFSV